MKKKVIKYNNLPTRIPLWSTIVAYLLLDKFNAPGWVWGAFGLLSVIVWALCLVSIFSDDYIDIFKEKTIK